MAQKPKKSRIPLKWFLKEVQLKLVAGSTILALLWASGFREFRLTVLDSLGLAVFTRLRSESGSLQ